MRECYNISCVQAGAEADNEEDPAPESCMPGGDIAGQHLDALLDGALTGLYLISHSAQAAALPLHCCLSDLRSLGILHCGISDLMSCESMPCIHTNNEGPGLHSRSGAEGTSCRREGVHGGGGGGDRGGHGVAGAPGGAGGEGRPGTAGTWSARHRARDLRRRRPGGRHPRSAPDQAFNSTWF